MISRLCAAVLVMVPMTAFAQGDPGPFGGFFGRTTERSGRDYTVLELRTSSGAQYDDPVLDPLDPSGPRFDDGALLGASGQLQFDRHSDRLQLQVRSAGTFHYFLQQPAVGGTLTDTRASVSGKPTTRLQLDAGAAHMYQPFFNYEHVPFAPQPGVVPPTARYLARAVESHSVEGHAGVTSLYSKNSSFFASVQRRETRYLQNRDLDFKMNGMRGGWRRQLSRDLGLRLEYGREHLRLNSGDERDRIYETIDAGVDFLRGLSLTRHTTLNVKTQMAVMKQPPIGRFYRLNGGASLSHMFHRTWRFTVRGERNTDFVPGFIEPLLGDTAGAQVDGLLSRRTEVLLVADGGRGRFGFNPNAGTFTIGSATAQVSYALTRTFGLFAQHAFFYYEMPEAASPLAPMTRLARQTVTFGITTRIPIYTRERSPSDSR